MVNYNRVVCNLAVLATVLTVAYTTPVVPSDPEGYVDLRQTNGKYNVRVKLENILMAVVPADVIKITTSHLNDLAEISEIANLIKPLNSNITSDKSEADSSNKPDKPNTEKHEKPAESPIKLFVERETQKNTTTIDKLEATVQSFKKGLAKFLIPFIKLVNDQ